MEIRHRLGISSDVSDGRWSTGKASQKHATCQESSYLCLHGIKPLLQACHFLRAAAFTSCLQHITPSLFGGSGSAHGYPDCQIPHCRFVQKAASSYDRNLVMKDQTCSIYNAMRISRVPQYLMWCVSWKFPCVRLSPHMRSHCCLVACV